MLQASACAAQIQSLGYQPGEPGHITQPPPAEGATAAEEQQQKPLVTRNRKGGEVKSAEELKQEAIGWQERLCASIVRGIAIAQSIKEDYLLLNAVTTLWNHHLHVFHLQVRAPCCKIAPLRD